jgi:hypothetical protein
MAVAAVSAVARLVTTHYPHGDVQSVWTWCPGCESLHPFRLAPGDERGVFWEWDGNLDRPTFSPSLLCHSSVHLCEGEHDPVPCEDPDCASKSHTLGAVVDGVLRWRFPSGFPEGAEQVRAHTPPHTRDPAFGPCHSFLHGGRWQFLADSAHRLAGQQVDMVPLPESWQGTA